MTDFARGNALIRELQVLHDRHGRLAPADIVGIARKVGLSAGETLEAIYDHADFRPDLRRNRGGSIVFAVPRFVSRICSRAGAGRVLEYAAMPSLTGKLLDSGDAVAVTYVLPDRGYAEALAGLLEGTPHAAVPEIGEIPEGAKFDTIVCQPPLGATGDTFGSERVLCLAPHVAADGILLWITGRRALTDALARKAISALGRKGLHEIAAIELPPGMFPGSAIEGAVVALRRGSAAKRMAGVLRGFDTAEQMADALVEGPTTRNGPTWAWLDIANSRTFADLERERLLRHITPKGRHVFSRLDDLLAAREIGKADKPLRADEREGALCFIPEYALSKVASDLDEQSVKPSAVYRLSIDPEKVNPRFLVQLLNSPFGRELRASRAHGATIQRLSSSAIRELSLPIPDAATQEKVARIESDLRLLQAAVGDLHAGLEADWTNLDEVAETTSALKSVLDIEQRIADWWRVLPYPLATIYRRYRVSGDPKERLETLLHFFEMAAIYLAAVGTSHVKALRQEWRPLIAAWLHPPGGSHIERADFGFWINLAAASLKEVRRIVSGDMRSAATQIAGPELVAVAERLGQLGAAIEPLNAARQYRNNWKGHGGHLKPSDAIRLCDELQQQVREFYEAAGSIFSRFLLIRTGAADYDGASFRHQAELLAGSDPTFAKLRIELHSPARSGALAFWMRDAHTACHALPFFRLGAPQRPQENTVYVYNRVEDGSFRWVSYQEAREQDVIANDEELSAIILLRT